MSQLRAALWVVFVGLAAVGFGTKPAWAAPSLILLEDNSGTNPVYRQVIESLGAVIVANNLSHYYDHIDVLKGSLANRDALFAQIRKRGAKSAVDGTYGLDGLHDRGSRCPQRRCGPLLRHDASSPDSVNTPRWAAKLQLWAGSGAGRARLSSRNCRRRWNFGSCVGEPGWAVVQASVRGPGPEGAH